MDMLVGYRGGYRRRTGALVRRASVMVVRDTEMILVLIAGVASDVPRMPRMRRHQTLRRRQVAMTPRTNAGIEKAVPTFPRHIPAIALAGGRYVAATLRTNAGTAMPKPVIPTTGGRFVFVGGGGVYSSLGVKGPIAFAGGTPSGGGGGVDPISSLIFSSLILRGMRGSFGSAAAPAINRTMSFIARQVAASKSVRVRHVS